MPKVRSGDVVWVEPKLVAEVEFAEWTHGRPAARARLCRSARRQAADEVRRERDAVPAEIRRGRRVLKLSNLDKPFWPEEGITKGDLLGYYRDVAPVLVPHLRGPAVHHEALPRRLAGEALLPEGRAEAHARLDPAAPFPASTREGEKRISTTRSSNDELALLWMVNMGCIDMNAWTRASTSPIAPTGSSSTSTPRRTPASRRSSRWRCSSSRRSTSLGLESFRRRAARAGSTSSCRSRGGTRSTQTREFAAIVAGALARTHPGLVTTEWAKRKRRGVLVDANQNGPGKTTASVYSVRPRAGAPVSTPLRWDEVTRAARSRRVHDGRGARPCRPARRPLRRAC